MKFGSLFTGVGGFDLGFEHAGFECVWQVERDSHCLEVLAEHYPNVERYTDVRTVGRNNLEPVDVICGGFPCQDVSIAGKRAGLAGERSGLWSEFARIIDELEPKWVVIENVPGLLSSNRGRDFATVIRWLAERGYGVAWRILDSQYFGVAQRRRRVFIVGSFGNGSAAEILFESEGLRWNIEKGRKTGEGTAGTIEDSTALGFDLAQITSKANYSNPKWGDPQPPLNTFGQGYIAYENHPADSRITETGSIGQQDANVVVMSSGQANAEIMSERSPALTGLHEQPIVAYNISAYNSNSMLSDNPNSGIQVVDTVRTPDNNGGNPACNQGGVMIVLNDQGGSQMSVSENVSATVKTQSSVRRLTPTECERLQGFPDGWTESQSDTQRYKQMGNAVTVNVAEWIGKRIAEVNK